MSGPQAQVVARIPGAAALGLVPPEGAPAVPAGRLADPAWLGRVLAERSARGGGTPRVHATVWWYSASAVLMAPVLAGLAVGRPLSARPADTAVVLGPGGLPAAAVSAAPAEDPAAGLRECLTVVVPAVAAAGRMRPRPLWAIATDSLANGLLTLGRALGDVPAVTALAAPLAEAVGAPLPAPRYVDVDGVRFTARVSCCLVDRLPGGGTCLSCPRRPPAERQVLLEDAAARG
ncbi:iron reductase [Blastococcus sp. MG754426]|uniref:(2Fe-2S)-binding protein n=1 Tax=unclassified Blastococcus TaxID=2619396 RepID=UPI001EF0E9C0|nr:MULTISPECIES: (2Fe-2S)-binding protein [unclassified Blastococcus]MCF6509782.1 iron reductase [Blastococcus sp. MG754426]MCF6514226.1 iron reductase [Blastococcus sp. MG754427]MCF6737335.1 iron reductase [Blastococcus sp. KM273129]